MYHSESDPRRMYPLPDIESMGSGTEYTGLVPAARSPEEEETELRPFGDKEDALPAHRKK